MPLILSASSRGPASHFEIESTCGRLEGDSGNSNYTLFFKPVEFLVQKKTAADFLELVCSWPFSACDIMLGISNEVLVITGLLLC